MTGNAPGASSRNLSSCTRAKKLGRTFYVQRVRTAHEFDTGCGGYGNRQKTETYLLNPVTIGYRLRAHFGDAIEENVLRPSLSVGGDDEVRA